MGTPSISVGSRQNGRACGESVRRCEMDFDSMFFHTSYQLECSYPPSNMFGDGAAGKRIAQKIGEILNG